MVTALEESIEEDSLEQDSLVVVVNKTDTLTIPDLNTKHYVNNASFIEKLFKNRNIEDTSPVLNSLSSHPITSLPTTSITTSVDTYVNPSLTVSTDSSSINSGNSTPITTYSDDIFPSKPYISVGPTGIIFTDSQESLDYNINRYKLV